MRLGYLYFILSVTLSIIPQILVNVCNRMSRPQKYHIVQELNSVSKKEKKRWRKMNIPMIDHENNSIVFEGTVEAATYFSHFCSAKPFEESIEYYAIELFDKNGNIKYDIDKRIEQFENSQNEEDEPLL